MIIANQQKENKKGGFEWVDYRGKKIILENFKDCDIDEVLSLMDIGRKIIRSQAKESLLELVDVTNAKYNLEVAEQMKEYALGNKPFSKKCAVVGIEGMKSVIIQAVTLFSGREFKIFGDLESAKDWLIKE